MKLSAICTLGATRTGSALLGQLSQPPLQVIEAALDVVQLGQELQRVLPADGVPGAGGEHGDAAAELLDVEAPFHAIDLVEQAFDSKRASQRSRWLEEWHQPCGLATA